MQRLIRPSTLLALIAVTLVAACATASDETSGEAGTAPPTTATMATTTVSTDGTVTTTSLEENAPELSIKWSNVEYLSDAEGSWTMDVYAPDGGGPWPLVVVYHGMTTGASNAESLQIARTGAVAVAPHWLKKVSPQITAEEYMNGALFDRAACATAVAQQMAPELGADPSNTTIAGFSAGMHPATWIALGLVRSMEGCGAVLQEPSALVAGDSQFTWFLDAFDETIADPTSQAADTVDRFVNPSRWEVSDDLTVYLWTSDFRHGRDLEVPVPDDSWIHIRDTTGSLLDDLKSVGALDDEFVDFGDSADVMAMWMNEAGIDVTNERVGGGHEYGPKVYAAIDGLIHRDSNN